MLVLISPAKKLNEKLEKHAPAATKALLKNSSEKVMQRLQMLSKNEIASLMKLSDSLSELNFKRYQSFKSPSVKKSAMYLYAGDTYTGLQAQSMDENVIKMAQQKLRILSGLYGVLRPLDEIVPHRLEMGTSLPIENNKNLYQWWQKEVTSQINKDLQKVDFLANLASNEYFKVVDTKSLIRPIIHFKFLDYKNGQYKLISFNAKRARGAMARIILEKEITKPEQLKKIEFDGYQFNSEFSNNNTMSYTRK